MVVTSCLSGPHAALFLPCMLIASDLLLEDAGCTYNRNKKKVVADPFGLFMHDPILLHLQDHFQNDQFLSSGR